MKGYDAQTSGMFLRNKYNKTFNLIKKKIETFLLFNYLKSWKINVLK